DNRYAWTKIGDVHAVDAIRLKRVNVMGCLLSTGKLVTSCLQESVKSTWFYAYLTGIAQQVKQMYNPLLSHNFSQEEAHLSFLLFYGYFIG
ncbi:hypothetical protein NL389_29020, partial [Klebsiella pneumoniae]|nr:hypothetical protein [Klebsiella pneumoniae]